MHHQTFAQPDSVIVLAIYTRHTVASYFQSFQGNDDVAPPLCSVQIDQAPYAIRTTAAFTETRKILIAL